MTTDPSILAEADTVRLYAAAAPEFFVTLNSFERPVTSITGWPPDELVETTDRILRRLETDGFTASRDAVFLQIARAQANHTGNIRLMDAGLLGDL